MFGIIQNFFDLKVISDYAIELMDQGNDDDFINELAWGIKPDELQSVLFELKRKYFLIMWIEGGNDYKF